MPAAPDPRLDQMFPRLSPEEIDRLRRFGTIRRYAAGDPVVTTGEIDSGMFVLISIFEHKQEARNPFFRVVELTDETEDPALWGKNFPMQYDDYRRTVDQQRTRFGGSEALPRTPTKADPRSVVAQSRIEERFGRFNAR